MRPLADASTLGGRAATVPGPNQRTVGRRPAWTAPRWWDDGIGIAGVLTVTVAAGIHLLAGEMLVGQDSATQFYPWYGYLGDQLGQGQIPEWSPFQFAGSPFAADPQSGWMYLPAMLCFGMLPLSVAAPVFLLFHLVLAGLGTYALGRVLGMPPAAATVAAVAYELTGPVYGRAVCCPAAMEIATWTPVALLGVELAVRARTWLVRIGGWSVAGLALSQALAAWLGQGSYYLLLAIAGYVAYRTLLAPIDGGRPVWDRLKLAVLHGLAVLALGFGFAAASVLPRLDYVARSNVAGGEYNGASNWAAAIGGATPVSVLDRLFFPSLHYPGTATLALALVALFLVRGRHAAPYFAVMAVVGVILAAPRITPLHALLYAVLPRFEELHQHWPERVSFVAYLAPAMLAGAAVATTLNTPGSRRHRLPVVLAPVAAILILQIVGAGIPLAAFLATAAVAVGLAVLVGSPSRPLRAAMPVLVVVTVAADLIAAGRSVAADAPYGGFHRLDVADYYAPSGAAEFLRARDAEQPSRYFGYDPALRTDQNGQDVLYRNQFADPAAGALLVNNRATALGLSDIQGYNPVQPRRYAEFMTALNGHPQDYHDANVHSAGLDSPLLDLLNARYVVVPASGDATRTDLVWLREHYPIFYEDAEVRVLENPDALPRAWVVHEAIEVESGGALPLLASGAVDPRTTALLEDAPPPLERPTDPSLDEVSIIEREPDRLRLTTTTSAPGLVVLGEVFDPGWKATVNGATASVLVADHVLRAVAIPAGTSTIQFVYEAPGLRLGGVISLTTIAAVLASAILVRWPVRRRRERGPTPHAASVK